MIPFSPPRLDDKVAEAVKEALLSGWITTGPRTKEFEKRLAAYCGVDTCLCLNSWTNAAEIFFRWWGIREGDEVILPAYTYCATANIVEHCGATVVLADSDEDGLIDFDHVRRLINERTKIIMPVDLGGLPVDYPELFNLIAEDEIKAKFKPSNQQQASLGRILVFADAAHSFGAKRRNGSRSGSWADISGFSFHAVKNLTTAEGGALTFNFKGALDESELYRDLNILSLHGQTKDALSKNQPGAWKYDVIQPGYKCNMTDLQAAIGLVELERYDTETLVKRKALFNHYQKLLEDKAWAILPKSERSGFESSYHLFMLRLKDFSEEQRDLIIHELGQRQIASNVHFQPLPLLSYYKNVGYNMADYPGAWNYYHNEISLPLFYDLSHDQQGTIVDALDEIISGLS